MTVPVSTSLVPGPIVACCTLVAQIPVMKRSLGNWTRLHACIYQWCNYDIIFTGMSVVLVVNNLGGTSNMDLSTMANAAIRHLGMYSYYIITGECESHTQWWEMLRVSLSHAWGFKLVESLSFFGMGVGGKRWYQHNNKKSKWYGLLMLRLIL